MTKTISVSEEAYKALKRQKLQGESFSDTILRLSKKITKLSETLTLYPELKGNREYFRATTQLRETIDGSLD